MASKPKTAPKKTKARLRTVKSEDDKLEAAKSPAVGSNAVGSNAVGSNAVGSNAVGSPAAGSATAGSSTAKAEGVRKHTRKASSGTNVAPQSRSRVAARPAVVSRRPVQNDDDDVLMASGGGGSGFGRCGGRLLSSRLEQQLCNRLGIAGVVHTHNPRHYEIRFENGSVAAYAPMIVLRGRGREGKGVVIEAVEEPNAPILRKIVAFRAQYGQEFYVILVAPDDVLDLVPLASHDESCSATNVNTLIARLAE